MSRSAQSRPPQAANPRRRMPQIGRVLVFVLCATFALAPQRALANTTLNDPCGARCYAIITQGVDLFGGSLTLSNVSSATATEEDFCQIPSSSSHITVADLWLITPAHPSGPEYQSINWQAEWIETGITRGAVNGATVPLSFFWARQYWSPSYGRYLYNEYLLSGSPSGFVNYTANIQWKTTGSWSVYRSGVAQRTGIASQQGPGSHQGLEAGAEMSTSQDRDSGEVSHLADVQSGTTRNYWSGYVYYAQGVFTISQDSTHLTFQTAC